MSPCPGYEHPQFGGAQLHASPGVSWPETQLIFLDHISQTREAAKSTAECRQRSHLLKVSIVKALFMHEHMGTAQKPVEEVVCV